MQDKPLRVQYARMSLTYCSVRHRIQSSGEASESKQWVWKQWLPLLGDLTVWGTGNIVPIWEALAHKISSCSTIKICAITLCIWYIHSNTLIPPIRIFIAAYNTHILFWACNSLCQAQPPEAETKDWQTFSVKGQIVNVFAFASHPFSAVNSHLCHCSYTEFIN